MRPLNAPIWRGIPRAMLACAPEKALADADKALTEAAEARKHLSRAKDRAKKAGA